MSSEVESYQSILPLVTLLVHGLALRVEKRWQTATLFSCVEQHHRQKAKLC